MFGARGSNRPISVTASDTHPSEVPSETAPDAVQWSSSIELTVVTSTPSSVISAS